MADLVEWLNDIERSIKNETYRPGPWKRFLAEASHRPPEERGKLVDAVDRVSDLLHLRDGKATFPFEMAVVAEAGAAVLGAATLQAAMEMQSHLLGMASLGLLAVSFQPLVKIGVGLPLGIRYSYAFLWGLEPRFKMRYGTYLAAPRTSRALLHLAGCIGSPLAAFLVARRLRTRLPAISKLAALAGWTMLGTNTAFFIAGLNGVRKLGPLPVTAGSGGALGEELRAAR
ncbi:MAG: hypothetical protein ACYCW6_23800 [Candidatus Xenobia bacterium]